MQHKLVSVLQLQNAVKFAASVVMLRMNGFSHGFLLTVNHR